MIRSEATMRATWRGLGGADIDTTIGAVIAAYRAPSRHYHTAVHVAAVLGQIEDLLVDCGGLAGVEVDADVVRAGGLFHDVVYDTTSSTNEADSAVLAVQAMRALGWQERRLAALEQIIVATAAHRAESAEAALLIDADLAILGASSSGYHRYVDAVRDEYADVDDERWIIGRCGVLQMFLDRPFIYTTPTMRAAREQQARANLEAELCSLRLRRHEGDDVDE